MQQSLYLFHTRSPTKPYPQKILDKKYMGIVSLKISESILYVWVGKGGQRGLNKYKMPHGVLYSNLNIARHQISGYYIAIGTQIFQNLSLFGCMIVFHNLFIMPLPNGLEAYMFLSCPSVCLSIRLSVRPLRFFCHNN